MPRGLPVSASICCCLPSSASVCRPLLLAVLSPSLQARCLLAPALCRGLSGYSVALRLLLGPCIGTRMSLLPVVSENDGRSGIPAATLPPPAARFCLYLLLSALLCLCLPSSAGLLLILFLDLFLSCLYAVVHAPALRRCSLSFLPLSAVLCRRLHLSAPACCYLPLSAVFCLSPLS